MGCGIFIVVVNILFSEDVLSRSFRENKRRSRGSRRNNSFTRLGLPAPEGAATTNRRPPVIGGPLACIDPCIDPCIELNAASSWPYPGTSWRPGTEMRARFYPGSTPAGMRSMQAMRCGRRRFACYGCTRCAPPMRRNSRPRSSPPNADRHRWNSSPSISALPPLPARKASCSWTCTRQSRRPPRLAAGVGLGSLDPGYLNSGR